MLRNLAPLLLAAASFIAVSACSGSADDRRPSERQVNTEPAHDAPDPTDKSGETGEPPVVATPQVIEINAPKAPRDPRLVPTQPITQTPASIAWRELASVPAKLEFVYVASGVIARSRDGAYALNRDGQLELQPKLELPDQPLLGDWPDDVWYLETTKGNSHRLLTLSPKRTWIASRYQGQKRWVGQPPALRKGWLEGLLIREGSKLARVGSRKSAPKIGVRMGQVILDTIETTSGRLYNISLRPTGVYVQTACFNRSCVDEHAKKLPYDGKWTFGDQVPRQRNSLSMVATMNVDGIEAHHLLHYEVGGWSLEPLVYAPSGLWPAPDGGLWLVIRDELMHRTAKGDWYTIALPEGLRDRGNLSAAMRFDQDEFWIGVATAGKTRVFATDATIPEPG